MDTRTLTTTNLEGDGPIRWSRIISTYAGSNNSQWFDERKADGALGTATYTSFSGLDFVEGRVNGTLVVDVLKVDFGSLYSGVEGCLTVTDASSVSGTVCGALSDSSLFSVDFSDFSGAVDFTNVKGVSLALNSDGINGANVTRTAASINSIYVDGEDVSNHNVPISNHNIPISNHNVPISNHNIPISNHNVPVTSHNTVPNMSSLALSMLGLAMLGVARRKKPK